MEIREAQEGEVLVLAPDGSLASGEDCAALESKLAAVLKRGTRFVVVDCTSVAQLRASAVRSLIQASKKLGRRQGRIVLCAMNAKVHKAFTISGFNRDFVVVATREEALRRVLEPDAPPPARPSPTPPPTATEVVEAEPPAAASQDEASRKEASRDDASRDEEEVPAPTADVTTVLPGLDDALAKALLRALGGGPLLPARPGDAGDADLDGLAKAMLAALAGRSV
jgi:anti-anti-sigma factor